MHCIKYSHNVYFYTVKSYPFQILMSSQHITKKMQTLLKLFCLIFDKRSPLPLSPFFKINVNDITTENRMLAISIAELLSFSQLS